MRRPLICREMPLASVRFFFSSAFFLFLSAMVIACGPVPVETQSLRFGTLPILDALPAYVAEKEGFFTRQGVVVEIVPFASALERDAALQAGQIDGDISDLVATVFFNKDQERAKVVRVAMKTTPEQRMFAILAAPGLRIQSVSDLRNVEVAISTNSVIEYVTDQLLAGGGLAPAEIQKTEVTKIPVRMEMLTKGQVKAATLPEPFATLALEQGASLVIDDAKSGIGQSVVRFSQVALRRKPDAVRRFLVAYEQAAGAINSRPENYRALMVDKGKVPPSLKDSFKVPVFPGAAVPSEGEVAAVTRWLAGRKLLAGELPYKVLVEPGFLPRP